MTEVTTKNPAYQLKWKEQQRKFAWAKVYSVTKESHASDYKLYQLITRGGQVIAPKAAKDELLEAAEQLKKRWTCRNVDCQKFVKPEDFALFKGQEPCCKACLGYDE